MYLFCEIRSQEQEEEDLFALADFKKIEEDELKAKFEEEKASLHARLNAATVRSFDNPHMLCMCMISCGVCALGRCVLLRTHPT